MRRSFRPRLDRLERKGLLSVGPGLVDSMTAVAGRTASGPLVVETFTVTNVSDHEIAIDVGPSNEGFTVSQRGKTVENPTEGPTPQFLLVETIEPGRSRTIRSTWDGRSNLFDPTEPGREGPPLSGTFTITNGLDRTTSASVTIPKAWTVPVKLTHIVPPRPHAFVHSPPIFVPLASK